MPNNYKDTKKQNKNKKKSKINRKKYLLNKEQDNIPYTIIFTEQNRNKNK